MLYMLLGSTTSLQSTRGTGLGTEEGTALKRGGSRGTFPCSTSIWNHSSCLSLKVITATHLPTIPFLFLKSSTPFFSPNLLYLTHYLLPETHAMREVLLFLRFYDPSNPELQYEFLPPTLHYYIILLPSLLMWRITLLTTFFLSKVHRLCRSS